MCKAWKQLKISLSIFGIIINNTIWITRGAFIIQSFQKEFNIAVSHSKQEKDRCGDVEINWLYKISGSKSGEKITIILFFSINKEALSSPTLGLFASQYPQVVSCTCPKSSKSKEDLNGISFSSFHFIFPRCTKKEPLAMLPRSVVSLTGHSRVFWCSLDCLLETKEWP